MSAALLAAGIVGAALLFVGVPAVICKLISTADRIEGADAPFSEPPAARIANAYQRGGVPAVGKQYVKRVYRRRLIGLLRRGGLW